MSDHFRRLLVVVTGVVFAALRFGCTLLTAAVPFRRVEIRELRKRNGWRMAFPWE